jgi:DnaK suppressor protein
MHEMQGRLEEELRQTVARLQALGAQVSPELTDIAGETPFDSFDNAAAHAARETLFASRERLAARAQHLAAALERVREGTYGTCVECGEAIGSARLRAIPEVQTCVSCQERLDREGGRGRVPRPPIERDRGVREAPPVQVLAPEEESRPAVGTNGEAVVERPPAAEPAPEPGKRAARRPSKGGSRPHSRRRRHRAA